MSAAPEAPVALVELYRSLTIPQRRQLASGLGEIVDELYAAAQATVPSPDDLGVWATVEQHNEFMVQCGTARGLMDAGDRLDATAEGLGDASVAGVARAPVTARVLRVEPPRTYSFERGHGGRIVLDYIAGGCPLRGQMVVLYHGPEPAEVDDPAADPGFRCSLCGDHQVIPCGTCGGTGYGEDRENPCRDCDASGDQPCPDCAEGVG